MAAEIPEEAHKAAVKASYQTNVKTIYFHLEEIIKKILVHKSKWTAKYNGDLAKIAKGLLKHKSNKASKEKQCAHIHTSIPYIRSHEAIINSDARKSSASVGIHSSLRQTAMATSAIASRNEFSGMSSDRPEYI